MDTDAVAALSTVVGLEISKVVKDLGVCRKKLAELQVKARRGDVNVGNRSTTWHQFATSLVEQEAILLDALEITVYGPGSPEERIEGLRRFLEYDIRPG